MGLINRDDQTISANETFRLTQEGQERLMSFAGSQQDRVLCALETCGTSDRDEIARTSGLSKGQVNRLLVVLCQKGYIQRVGQGSGYTCPAMEEQ